MGNERWQAVFYVSGYSKKKKKASTKDLGEVGGRIFDIIIHYNEFCELAFSESL